MNISGMRIRSREYFSLERRVVANKTTESWENIPHAGILFDCDVTGILEVMERLRRAPEFAHVCVTLNTVMLKIFAEGVKRSPALNAHVDYCRRTSVGVATYFESINIAIPFVTKDKRTITPVVRDVETMTLLELCRAVERLKRRAENTDVEALLHRVAWRDAFLRLRRLDLSLIPRFIGNVLGPGRLKRPSRERFRAFDAQPESERITPDDLLSATFLVSNLGSMLPGYQVIPGIFEVIPPQAAALCLGTAVKKPVVVTDEDGKDSIAIRTMMPIMIMGDHRIMDLEHVTGFLEVLKAHSEAPEKLLE